MIYINHVIGFFLGWEKGFSLSLSLSIPVSIFANLLEPCFTASLINAHQLTRNVNLWNDCTKLASNNDKDSTHSCIYWVQIHFIHQTKYFGSRGTYILSILCFFLSLFLWKKIIHLRNKINWNVILEILLASLF